MSKKDLPPKPSNLLYENLFDRRNRNEALTLITKGVDACAENVGGLLEDAKLLATNERYARAGFLVATAEEEIAKAYILLDACRLDFKSHEDRLRKLCRAFYGHIQKYAVYRVVHIKQTVGLNFFPDLRCFKEWFVADLQRWWPADPESGEPDMPHNTVFTREENLYVDFIDYNQDWYSPVSKTNFYGLGLTPGEDKLAQCQASLDTLLQTRDKGLLKPNVLGVLNDTFKRNFINESTPISELFRLYETVAEKVNVQCAISPERFKGCSLEIWPLYGFL